MTHARLISPRTTVVFDIYGTLLDEAGTIMAETTDALGSTLGNERAAAFANSWQEQVSAQVRAVVNGEKQWRGTDDIHQAVLAKLLTDHGLAPAGAEYIALAQVAHRLSAFTGAATGLESLSQSARVIGLTNTDLAAASDASAGAGLRWHALLSTELARTFKPRPDAYRLAEDLAGVDPDHSIFVAAHPWDLRAAARRGYVTAYLPRPHTDNDAAEGEFDHHVDSLEALIPIAAALSMATSDVPEESEPASPRIR